MIASGSTPATPSKKGWQPPLNNSCLICEKAVYFMDKTEVDGKVFHKTCFKCDHCKVTLRAGNYAGLDGKVFCKPHFKQLFQLKGRYTFAATAEATEKATPKPIAASSSTSALAKTTTTTTTTMVSPAPGVSTARNSYMRTAAPPGLDLVRQETSNKSSALAAAQLVAKGPRLADRLKAFTSAVTSASSSERLNLTEGTATTGPTTESTGAKRESTSAMGAVGGIASRFTAAAATSGDAASPIPAQAATTTTPRRRSSSKIEAALKTFSLADATSSSSSSKHELTEAVTPAVAPRKASNGRSVLAAVAMFENFVTSASSSPASLRPKFVFRGATTTESVVDETPARPRGRDRTSITQAAGATTPHMQVTEETPTPSSTDTAQEVPTPTVLAARAVDVCGALATSGSSEPLAMSVPLTSFLTAASPSPLQRGESTFSTMSSTSFTEHEPTIEEHEPIFCSLQEEETGTEAVAAAVHEEEAPLNTTEEDHTALQTYRTLGEQEEDSTAPFTDFEACDGVLDMEDEHDEEEEEEEEEEDDEDEEEAVEVEETQQAVPQMEAEEENEEDLGSLEEVSRRLSRRLSSLLNVSDAFTVDMATLSIDSSKENGPQAPPANTSRKSSSATLSLDLAQPTPLGRRLSSFLNVAALFDGEYDTLTTVN